MKRRVLFGFVSAALVVTMCAAIVGCGGVDAESFKGEEVTEKQWNAALAYFSDEEAVYTIHFSMEETSEEKCVYLDEELSGGTKTVRTIEAVKNEGREYIKTTWKTELSGDMKKIAAAVDDEVKVVDEESERYATRKDGSYTVYMLNDDDEWITIDTTNSIIPIREFVTEIPLSYDSYEYSSVSKGYVLKNALKVGTMYVVKFNKDGQLSAIHFNYEMSVVSGNLEKKSGHKIDIMIEYKADDIELPKVS